MLRSIRLFLQRLIPLFVFALVACGGGSSDIAPTTSDATTRMRLLQTMPTDASRQVVQLHPGPASESDWQVLREWPQGEIRILARNKDGWRGLPFPGGTTALLKLVVEAPDALYMFTYDVERNLPSGRGLHGVSEGIDLWRVDRDASQVIPLAQGLALGGVDNLLVARADSGIVDVCTVDICLRVSADGKSQRWVTGVPDGYELVELKFANEHAYALVRRLDDRITGLADLSQPSFAVVSLPQPGSTALPNFQTVAADCLPFRLRWADGQPTWSCAKNATEMAEVFRGDLRRIPHNGVGDVGLSNAEGRIAWGLDYQLSALVHLDSHNTPRLAAAADWQAMRVFLVEALELVARQGWATELGHASRRYSQDRSPLLFALHLGRIARLLSSAEDAGLSSADITRALEILRVQLLALEGTAEFQMQSGTYTTLGYRKGIAFWADGANVPHNYVSGYVHGLLASAVEPANHGQRAANLLAPLMYLEGLANRDIWPYWWGLGYSGWTEADAVSINTPAYAGTNGVAHITYRSMDAMAVLRLASVMPSEVDSRVVQNMRKLVAKGYLLPFVNQELVRLGGAQRIDTAVALRYARSAAPWELQAQLFALETLAGL